ncbi:hypothetical protein SOHN41_01387 [Shewanella sp. HN-41]|nr:hypothetical protein SOHN41_01387 [Shewanella sp. HN-41]
MAATTQDHAAIDVDGEDERDSGAPLFVAVIAILPTSRL